MRSLATTLCLVSGVAGCAQTPPQQTVTRAPAPLDPEYVRIQAHLRDEPPVRAYREASITTSDELDCRMQAQTAQAAAHNPRAFLDLEAIGTGNYVMSLCMQAKAARANGD